MYSASHLREGLLRGGCLAYMRKGPNVLLEPQRRSYDALNRVEIPFAAFIVTESCTERKLCKLNTVYLAMFG